MDSRAGKFVTCFCCVVDTLRKEIVYANAGHQEQYLLKSRTGKIVRLQARLNLPLGVLPDKQFQEKRIRYDYGDVLLFYTDGVTDAVNPKCRHYGERRLRWRLRRSKGASSEDIIHELIDDIKKHQGRAEPADDITLMAINIKDSSLSSSTNNKEKR
jgi:sigma-B regulation protein RsbU (phosphoserine phosphatase)